MRNFHLLLVAAITLFVLTSNSSAFYDYQTGRWLNQDPIGYQDSVNLYAYVSSNPVNMADPMGFLQETGGYRWVTDPPEGSCPAICQERHPGDNSSRINCLDECYANLCGNGEDDYGGGFVPNDIEGGRCGPDVGWAMGRLKAQIDQKWLELKSEPQIRYRICHDMVDINGWDIREFFEKKYEVVDEKNGCPTNCPDTVTIYGKCYDMSAVNYWLWGYFNYKCVGSITGGRFDMYAYKFFGTESHHLPWSDSLCETRAWFEAGASGGLPLNSDGVCSTHEHCGACTKLWEGHLTAHWGDDVFIGGDPYDIGQGIR